MNLGKYAQKTMKKIVKHSPIADGMLQIAAKKDSTLKLPEVDEARSTLQAISPRPASMFREFQYEEPISCDLSVVIPVYNTEKYIGDCLRSVLTQEISFDIEVIVVNDGSTDSSLEIVNKFALRDSRVKVINQSNQGFSGARNIAIDHIGGNYLCFVDSDDMLAPGHLQHLWDGFKSKRGGNNFVSGLYSKMNEKGRVIGTAEHIRTHGGPCARIYTRNQWRDIRFPEGFWFEDTVITYCLKSRYCEEFVQDVGYLRRMRKDSITTTAMKHPKALDSYWVVEEMLDWCRELRIPLEKLYHQTLVQFGALLYDRVAFLKDEQLRALFVCCSELIHSVPEWEIMYGCEQGRLAYLERSLLERNYRLWLVFCRWI